MSLFVENPFFKLGLQLPNNQSLQSLLNDKVKSAYQVLNEEVKNKVSLLDFSLLLNTSRTLLQRMSSMDPETLENVRLDVEIRLNDLQLAALNFLNRIPADASSDDIDGYLASCVQRQEASSTRHLDQWNYVKPNGRLDKSCESLSPSSLFSNTTVQKSLNAKTVHFMMFDEGSTRINCIRFSFGESQLDTDPEAVGDPTVVPENFCNHLGLSDEVQKQLPIHALRLKMAQDVLWRISDVFKPKTQALFVHVLSMLLCSLDKNKISSTLTAIDDVTGMQEMQVEVEVCAAYLRTQAEANRLPTENIRSMKKSLKIKSDLAVSVLPDPSKQPSNTNLPQEDSALDETDFSNLAQQKHMRLLFCNFHIEMKCAHGELKHGGRQPKSQLLAASLARSIEFKQRSVNRNVIFSILTDCCSLYVLVHFLDSGNAYLSRREVEPCRMVVVITWVHLMSTQCLSKSSTFSEKSFVAKFSVGNVRFADEFRKQKRGNHQNSKQEYKPKKQSQHKQAHEPSLEMDELVAEEEMDFATERMRAHQEAFVIYRNHYNFGWSLPPLQQNLATATQSQDNSAAQLRTGRLARAGLS